MGDPTSKEVLSYMACLIAHSASSCSTMVRAQMLSELEEIILYKQNADQPDRQLSMRRTWSKRYINIIVGLAAPLIMLQIARLPTRRGGLATCAPSQVSCD